MWSGMLVESVCHLTLGFWWLTYEKESRDLFGLMDLVLGVVVMWTGRRQRLCCCCCCRSVLLVSVGTVWIWAQTAGAGAGAHWIARSVLFGIPIVMHLTEGNVGASGCLGFYQLLVFLFDHFTKICEDTSLGKRKSSYMWVILEVDVEAG